jgi:hypothetical protein
VFGSAHIFMSPFKSLLMRLFSCKRHTCYGPLTGTAAAGWQSSIGLVSSGRSAWCQSAAMGGAAVGGAAEVELSRQQPH